MRRIARGVDKFVLKSASPYVVAVNHSGEFRGQVLGEPLQTVTAKNGYGVINPLMMPLQPVHTAGAVRYSPSVRL